MMRAVHSCCIVITAECTSTGISDLDQKWKDLLAIRKCMRSQSWALPVRLERHVYITQKGAASGGFLRSSVSARARQRRRPFSFGGAVVDLGGGDWGGRKYEDMTSGAIKVVEPADENDPPLCDLDHEPPPSRSTKFNTLSLFSKVTKGMSPEESAGNIVELMQEQEPTSNIARTALGEDVDDRKDHEPHHQQLRRSRSRSGVEAVVASATATVTGDICAGESGLTSAENHNGSGGTEELESSRSSNNNTDGSSILLESAAESVVSRSSISNNNNNNHNLNRELQSAAIPGVQHLLRMHEHRSLQRVTYTTGNGAAGEGAGAPGRGGSSVGWSTNPHMNGGFPPMNDSSSNLGINDMSMRTEAMIDMGPEGLGVARPGPRHGGRGSSNERAFRSLAAYDRELPFSLQSASVVPSDQRWPRGSNAQSQEESWLKLGVGPSVDSSSSVAAATLGLSFHSSSSHQVAPTDGDPRDHDRPWSGQQQGYTYEKSFSREKNPSMGMSFPITAGNFNRQTEFLPTDLATVKSSQAIMPAAAHTAAKEQWHPHHRRDSSIISSEYGRATTSGTGGPSTTYFSPATLRRVPIAAADAAAASISTGDHAGASGSPTVHFPTFTTNVGQSTLFLGGGGIPMNAIESESGGAAVAADARGQQAFGPGRSTSGGSASVIRTSAMRNASGEGTALDLASLSQRDTVGEERFYDTRSQIRAVFKTPATDGEFPNASSNSLGRYGPYNNLDGPAVPSRISSSELPTGIGGGVHGQFSRVEHGYGSWSAVGRSTDFDYNDLHFQADGQPYSLASLMQTRDGDFRGARGTTESGVASGHPWHPPPAFEAGGQVPSSKLIPHGKTSQGWTSNANTFGPISNANSTAAGTAAAFNAHSHSRADDGPVSIAIDPPQQAIRASDESWGSYFRKVSPNSNMVQSSTVLTGYDRELHAQLLHPPPDEGKAFQSTSFSHHHYDQDDRSLAALPASREDGDHENLGVWKRAINHIQARPAWPPAETLNLAPVAWPSSSTGNGLRSDLKLGSSFDASSLEAPLISPFLSEPSFTARGDRVNRRATPPRRQTWQQHQHRQQEQKHARSHYSCSANAPHKQSSLTVEKAKLRMLSSSESDSRGSRHAPGLWFILQSAESQNEEGGLPQVSKAYLRVKDGKMTVSAVKKYLVTKLGLTSESEVEITCKGQPVVPSLPLQHVRDVIWFSNFAANSKAAAQTLASSHSSELEDHDRDPDRDRDEEPMVRATMLPAGAHGDRDSERQYQLGSMLSPDGADSASASASASAAATAAAAAAAAATIISNDILMVLTYRRHSRDRTLPLTTFLT